MQFNILKLIDFTPILYTAESTMQLDIEIEEREEEGEKEREKFICTKQIPRLPIAIFSYLDISGNYQSICQTGSPHQ